MHPKTVIAALNAAAEYLDTVGQPDDASLIDTIAERFIARANHVLESTTRTSNDLGASTRTASVPALAGHNWAAALASTDAANTAPEGFGGTPHIFSTNLINYTPRS